LLASLNAVICKVLDRSKTLFSLLSLTGLIVVSGKMTKNKQKALQKHALTQRS